MLADGSYLEQLSHDVLLTIGNDHIAAWSFGQLNMLNRQRAMLVSLLVFKLMLNANMRSFRVTGTKSA